MIFVTVGSQLPFDRLVRAMDSWSAAHPDEEIFAQIGAGGYLPENFPCERALKPDAFREKCAQASLIVSHAGIGNVLMSLELQKPLVLLPRRASLGEHRNDHQMATAHWLKEKRGIFIAFDEQELGAVIDAARKASVAGDFSPYASPELLEAVKSFIRG